MSLQEISAERRFWGTAELIENLLPFLDTSATNQLAESHKLTRRILRNSLSWNKLIERTFPHEQYTTMNHYSLPEPMDAILESERSQAVSLANILSLNKDPASQSQLEMDLLHAICERFSLTYKPGSIHANFVNVSCSCLQTHRVSLWGFMLLEDVEGILGSRAQIILEMAGTWNKELGEPLLTALGSRALRQEEMVERVRSRSVRCNNEKSVEALATLVEKTQAWGLGEIHVDKVIGAEGWTTIRKAVELLSRKRQMYTYVQMSSERHTMTAGKREDMKAIWDVIQDWEVKSDEGSVSYKMSFLNVDGRTDSGWEDWEGVYGPRKGLGSIIQMSHEEWLEEVREAVAQDLEKERNTYVPHWHYIQSFESYLAEYERNQIQ